MKQTGIVDRFEGDYVVVEVDDDQFVNFPRAEAPAMLGEGMVVIIEDGSIVQIDLAETQRIEENMRRRFERILGASSDD